MAAMHADGNNSSFSDTPPPTAADRRRGGWISTPFILAAVFGLTLASGGWSANLIVFLINEYNIKSVDAAQINNVVSGCTNFFPLVGAVLADSLLGCFSVIFISSLISLLGLILLVLTVTVDGLKPAACEASASAAALCAPPSRAEYAVVCSAVGLASIGVGGTRFTLATMGANQFEGMKQQASFFNWFFFTFYAAAFLSSTAIVYVEDNLGWGWGFWIGLAANVVGLALFFVGSPYYTRDNPHTSPFTGLLRVVVASIRKRKAIISSQPADYYYGDQGADADPPTNWFRALNRAALKTEGDVLENGAVARPWKLCSVLQVEDLKSIIRIMSLWSSSIFLATPIGVQISLTVVQALATNRRLTHTFQFPASSILVFSLISTAVGVVLIDHYIRPMWKRMSGNNPTPLQEIGVGHVFNVASMAVSALVESVVWLVPQMVVVGVGEAFHFPGQVGLYYQEFPACLKSLATAMVAMLIGVAFYLGTAVVDFIRRITDWLPDNIDDGRVDNVYWVMVVIGIINFGYFLVISWFYKYRNVEVVNKDMQIDDA